MLRKKLKIDTNDTICTTISTATDASESNFSQNQLWYQMYAVQRDMNFKFMKLEFDKDISAVYNPTIYAEELHCEYLKRYLTGQKHVLFLGMNPGPWGMCQTGVPFGYIPAVRDWLQLEGRVDKPNPEHPARPVTGLACNKPEQSGKRWWELLEKLCGTPDNFFRHCFVHNYCALAFFGPTGKKNITPNELKGNVKRQLQEICNDGMVKAIELISPKIIVCIGNYVQDRMMQIHKKKSIDETIEIVCLPHPSPRSRGNKHWGEKAEKWFIEHDILQYFNPDLHRR